MPWYLINIVETHLEINFQGYLSFLFYFHFRFWRKKNGNQFFSESSCINKIKSKIAFNRHIARKIHSVLHYNRNFGIKIESYNNSHEGRGYSDIGGGAILIWRYTGDWSKVENNFSHA